METSPIQHTAKSLLAELQPFSDRGLILVTASILDISLYKLLSKAIVDEEKLKENLLDSRGPLKTFSSRILAAYGFGLLRKDQYLDLQLFRKIRNECAHSFTNVLLENEPFRDRVSCLQQLEVYPNYVDVEYPPDDPLKIIFDDLPTNSRGVFIKKFILLNSGIFFRWVVVKPLKIDSLIDLSREPSP